MQIFNTLTNKLEEFKPINKDTVNMYVCGPTVYNYAHVGNMYPVIVFDMVARYFKYLGFKVNYASNFTDVDDKIINAATLEGKKEEEITTKFIEAYLKDCDILNCKNVTNRPKVTENMDNIIEFISLLLDKGYAYKEGDDVYFDVSKIKDYGILSKQTLEDLDYGNRIEVVSNKHNPYDFVLWKKTLKGITWNAPFGVGRPGWHTECVVMINNIFHNTIDIHGGGVDLKFPHHENELAQNKAAYGRDLANIWMHNGHIMVENQKMSKSLNNFILAKDLIKDYSCNVIRLSFLKNHYRSPLNLSKTSFIECQSIDEKISTALKQANLNIYLQNLRISDLTKDENINKIMDNDFNTPNLITYLIDLIKELNSEIRKTEDFTVTYGKINLILEILGLKYDLKEINEEDKKLYNDWLEARDNKDYTLADNLREKLKNLNIL